MKLSESIEKAKKRRAKLMAEYKREQRRAKGVPGVKTAMAVKHGVSAGRMWQLLKQAIEEGK